MWAPTKCLVGNLKPPDKSKAYSCFLSSSSSQSEKSKASCFLSKALVPAGSAVGQCVGFSNTTPADF